MKRNLLIAYQCVTGLSDTLTGLLLIAAPSPTLQLMRVHAALNSVLFLSYIGVFVLSVGLACLYGAGLALQRRYAEKLEVVWLLTAMTRGLVAVFVTFKVVSGAMEVGWSTVAFTDAALSIIQLIGLQRGWLRHVRD